MVVIFTWYKNHLQVVVVNFKERHCQPRHDGQERSGDNALHESGNTICELLGTGFYSFSKSMQYDSFR